MRIHRILGASLALLLWVGCSGPTSSKNKPDELELPDTPAADYLKIVFQRYRNAHSYHDKGVVRLDFQVGDQTQSETAPLEVVLDGSFLYMEAYDVRLLADQTKLTAWFVDPISENFDSQVLRTTVTTGRPKLEQVLADPVVHDKVTAGLAGPPPQLDWLLSKEPMKGLFNKDVQIDYEEALKVDDRLCYVINVDAQGQAYRFLIEAKTSLIREVELPILNLPRGFDAQMRLTLQLREASFDQPPKPSMSGFPRAAREVGRLVPVPPAKPASVLGNTPSAFSATDQSGQVSVSERGTNRAATILFFAERHRSKKQSAIGFANWVTTIPPETARQVHAILFVDEQTLAQLPQTMPLPVVIDRKEQIRKSISRDDDWNLAIMNSEGRIAWTQRIEGIDDLVALGPIIGDVIGGIDIPKRLRTQWLADVGAYRKMLDAEMRALQTNNKR